MEWCLDRVIAGDLDLDDVIWTDECMFGTTRVTSQDDVSQARGAI